MRSPYPPVRSPNPPLSGAPSYPTGYFHHPYSSQAQSQVALGSQFGQARSVSVAASCSQTQSSSGLGGLPPPPSLPYAPPKLPMGYPPGGAQPPGGPAPYPGLYPGYYASYMAAAYSALPGNAYRYAYPHTTGSYGASMAIRRSSPLPPPNVTTGTASQKSPGGVLPPPGLPASSAPVPSTSLTSSAYLSVPSTSQTDQLRTSPHVAAAVTAATAARRNFASPQQYSRRNVQGMTQDGHALNEYNPAAAASAAAAAVSGAYYYPGHHPAHAAWASAQHGYPPPPQGAYHPSMRGLMPPGMRPMGELAEEQQRQQQQYYQQQQQAAYAAHIQQQQLMAAAQQHQQQQMQQQQLQQQSSSSLQVPSADNAGGSRGGSCSTTPMPHTPARTATAGDSRAPSAGPPHNIPTSGATDSRIPTNDEAQQRLQQQQQGAQIRPPSQQPPRHTPTPGASYPYPASANAPTPPLTISTQQTSNTQQSNPQSQATPQPSSQQPSSQQAPVAPSSSSVTVSTSSTAPSTIQSQLPNSSMPYYAPPNAQSPYAMASMRLGAPGVRPPGGMVMYGGEMASAYPGMYPQQTVWAVPSHAGPHQPPPRYGGIPQTADYPGIHQQQQQQLRTQQQQQQQVFQQQQIAAQQQHQQQQQQQQQQFAEAQRRAAVAAGFYAPPPGSVAAPPPAVLMSTASTSASATSGSHSPASVQRARKEKPINTHNNVVMAFPHPLKYTKKIQEGANPEPTKSRVSKTMKENGKPMRRRVSKKMAAIAQQTPSYPQAHAQQQQLMVARAAAAAAAGGIPPGYAHHPAAAAAAAAAAQMNAVAHMAHGQAAAPSTSHLAAVNNFPVGSIEAITASSHLLKRRRPKFLTRDLSHSTPKRLLMSLRSGMHIESSWAINALNIILYDDTMPAFNLSAAPELLNVIVEHFIATLSLLYPKHFKTPKSDWLLNLADECGDGAASRDNTYDYVFDLSLATTTNSTPAPTVKLAKSRKSSLDVRKTKNSNRERRDTAVEAPARLVTVVADAKQPIRPVVRPPMGRSAKVAAATSSNYTRVSRTGRRVFVQECQLPANLAKLLPANVRIDRLDNQKTLVKTEIQDEDFNCKEERDNCSSGYSSDRLRSALLAWIEADQYIDSRRPFFNRGKSDSLTFWEPTTFDTFFPGDKSQDDRKTTTGTTDNIKKEMTDRPFTRHVDDEKRDRYIMSNNASVMRPFQDTDPLMQRVVDRCLALSNILRGMSFIAGHERLLCQHVGLLRLIAVQLRLLAECDDKVVVDNEPKMDTKIEAQSETTEKSEVEGKVDMPRLTKSEFPPKIAAARRLLIETANHLRDDAFTILAHISVQLDLYDVDGEVSWNIFDTLLHWGVSNSLQARDPMLPGVLSPKSYTLEILCKMSVIERNVDLLLSTGPWTRIEEFVRVLCGLINLEEDPPTREFAIVILNAICAASETACHVAAMETSVLNNLVAFLELADSKMHQIVQQQGMPALRENPELMGTSVGMLRRATLIMLHIARLKDCRKQFSKLQCRLLTFTTSHFMDSRVAAMVADILFEMQRSENNSVDLKFSPPLDVKPANSTPANDAEKTSDDAKDNGVLVDQVSQSSGDQSPQSSVSPSLPAIVSQPNGKNNEDDKFKAPTALKRSALALTKSSDVNNSTVVHVNGGDIDECHLKINSRKRPVSPYESKPRDENDVHLSTKKAASELVMEKLRSNIIHKHGEDQNCSSESPLKKAKLLNGAIHHNAAYTNHVGHDESQPNNHQNNESTKLNGQRNNGDSAVPHKTNNNNTLNDKLNDADNSTTADSNTTSTSTATSTSSITTSSTTTAITTTAQSQSGSMTAVA